MKFINLEKLKRKVSINRRSEVLDVEMLPSFQQANTKARKKAEAALIDLNLTHNTSWTRDVYNKNANNLEHNALFYRGNYITYRQLFENALRYASVFESKGIKEGDEIPMCMSNCPEFIYALMGANLLGAKINSFGVFDTEYLTEIMDDCSANFVICTDDRYPSIMTSIACSDKKEVVMVSLADSLPNGIDPYIEQDKEFYDFKNRVLDYQAVDSRIIPMKEFLSVIDGENTKSIEDYDIGRIDTDFLVTYTSGSTNEHRPKAMIHANRSLITMGRFQEPDLSGLPEMHDLIGEMIIPNHSNTSIIVSMSDVLYKGCTVAIEPIYDDKFLLHSLDINKPNYISVARQMLVNAMKQLYSDPNFKDFTMPYMMMLTSVGEPTSMGEEKFINKVLRKTKCGIKKLPQPFSPVPLSIGGGDCERGGMFFTSYRRYRDFLPQYSLTKSRCELKPYSVVQVAVLDKNGNELPYGEVGRLVAKTSTMMKCYKNNPEATKKLYLHDSMGREWTDCGVYAFIEHHGTVKILERIGKEVILSSGQLMPLYEIGNLVELDTKNILSYEVVNVDNCFVVHIELQPEHRDSKSNILLAIQKRIQAKFGDEVASKIIYRVRDFEESFPLSKCGKRSYPKLAEEGITDKCLVPVYIGENMTIRPINKVGGVKVYQKK